MTLKEAQKRVDDQIMAYGGYWNPLSMLWRLDEETGELSRAINITFGDKKAKSPLDGRAIENELADVFYTTIALANANQINLSKILGSEPIDKLKLKIELTKKNPTELDSSFNKLFGLKGQFADAMLGNNYAKMTRSITNIIRTIIVTAYELDINLADSFTMKVEDDESKMAKTYHN